MKILFSIFLFIISAKYAQPFAKQVHITTGEWPPYLSQEIHDEGCVAKLIKDVFALYDIKTHFAFMPWKRAYQEGMKSEFIGSAYWYFSQKRSADYIYTKQHITEEVSRFYHHINLPFTFGTYADLKPYVLLLNSGLTYPDKLRHAIETHKIPVIQATYIEKNLSMILKKRADIMIMNENTATEYQKLLSQKQRDQITFQPTPAFVKKGYLLINKQNQHYADLFNQGLETLLSNKVYRENYQKRCSRISL